MCWNRQYIEELKKKREEVLSAGGEKRKEAQHAKGKMTARERMEYLFDEGTFMETGALVESRTGDFGMDKKRIPGDGVVTGFGKIDGRLAYAASQDFTVIGGTLGEYHAKKIWNVMDMAVEQGAPFISINDSGGARIEEGIMALDGYGGIFLRHTRASGRIPQIAAVMGPCAGGACYAPALCDYVFMTETTSRMFITGPGVVKAVTGENVTADELGGAPAHAGRSGVAHFVYPDDRSCLNGIRKLLSYLQKKETVQEEGTEGQKERDRENLPYILQNLVPDDPRRGYDIRRVLGRVLDAEDFMEVQKDFGRSLIVGYGRLGGKVLGVVASQPSHMAGSLDIDASEKAARFVRCCDCFRIPVLTLVDVPGFLPGTTQEWGGIIRRGAKLLYAYSEATVPKVSLILRKAYGGAYIALNSKGLGADMVYAWPIAQIAVMGAEGAVDIIFRKEIENAKDREGKRRELVQQYDRQFMSPYLAAARGYIDEVIFPEETRGKLVAAFGALEGKLDRGRVAGHGNIPL